MPNITTNKKALADYKILEKFEAGIILAGPEVKSIKNGQVNLKGSYVTVDNQNQAWLLGTHVSAYKPAQANQVGYQPDHSRKLLLTKKEIDYLRGRQQQSGLTILPISVYTKGGLIKIEVGLAQGKKRFDKRATIKKREVEREIRRKLKKF